jgi:hypothetical protein
MPVYATYTYTRKHQSSHPSVNRACRNPNEPWDGHQDHCESDLGHGTMTIMTATTGQTHWLSLSNVHGNVQVFCGLHRIPADIFQML